MALRKRAINASVNTTESSPTPLSLPKTPRPRQSIAISQSPATTPSISTNVAFDWEAARSRAPYSTPQSGARLARRSMGASATPLRKGVIRKKSYYERIASIPSQISFQIAMFPANVPLPKPQTSAWIVGGTLHFIHLCIRFSQANNVPDSDLGWEDMYREGEGHSWFDWTVPVTLLLVAASFLNALYLLTRVKLYRLHLRSDPVSSPNAKFVAAQLDFQPLVPPPLSTRVLRSALFGFNTSWRFLLGFQLPVRNPPPPPKVARVQQLEVWTPGEFESMLFNVYSPAHSLLWCATGPSNWISNILIMGFVSAQSFLITHFFKTLIKDKEIIAAEVFNEYNTGFVYPRLNPVRADVGVQTHQSEVVNVWED
ncbi:hypothetical protein MIND_01030400 [Mycena indigotica]|uniref:Nuclear rim protein 1 n=1 Tax=Mycena indigotica TaxID=2126181 RepID=A0A8H6S9R6_9AGAR|nr:uncharacterized protein MIND_01030400 [Mycena indigotica]KAF7294923.1 hypothetical protein MIND_01030400 [Mycena indigotica]